LPSAFLILAAIKLISYLPQSPDFEEKDANQDAKQRRRSRGTATRKKKKSMRGFGPNDSWPQRLCTIIG